MLEGHCRLRVCALATSCCFVPRSAGTTSRELCFPRSSAATVGWKIQRTRRDIPHLPAVAWRGSEELTPFLRVIDNNFLERPFIPGLQTSSEYLWRISSIASLMGSGHEGRKGITEGFYFFPFQSNGSHGNVPSRRNKHFKIPLVVSCNVCSQLKRTLSQLHYFSKPAEIPQQKYFLSKM